MHIFINATLLLSIHISTNFSSIGACNADSVVVNTELVERIERMSKLIHLILVKWSTASTIISPLLVASVNYFILDMGDESFRFDGALWFPFDANKPAGFFLAVLFQFFGVCAVFCCVTPIVCVYIGSCWSIITFLKDLARDITHVDKKDMNLNEQALSERVCNFVRIHANVLELGRHIFPMPSHSHMILLKTLINFRLTGKI